MSESGGGWELIVWHIRKLHEAQTRKLRAENRLETLRMEVCNSANSSPSASWSFPRISQWNLTVLLTDESTMKTLTVCATHPLRANWSNAETIKCSSFYMLSELLHHSLKNLFSESCRCFSEEKKMQREKDFHSSISVWKPLTKAFPTRTHCGGCIFINSSITPIQC